MIRKATSAVLLLILGLAFYALLAGYEPDAELNRTAAYYAENTAQETGAQNIVTAIIVTYRGLDTLGEQHQSVLTQRGLGACHPLNPFLAAQQVLVIQVEDLDLVAPPLFGGEAGGFCIGQYA